MIANTIKDNTCAEGGETFAIALSGAVNATHGDPLGSETLRNDD